MTLLFLLGTLAGCVADPPLDSSAPSDALHQLTFEERMAIRAELTVIDSEAKAEAAEVHDRFASREAAIEYEKLVDRLQNDKRDALMEEHGLTVEDLNFIVNEYLQSRGVGLAK